MRIYACLINGFRLRFQEGCRMNQLKKSVQYVKNVGPKRKMILEKMGIITVEDLLYSFPREYEDRRRIQDLSLVKDGEKAFVKVIVYGKVQQNITKKGQKIFRVPIRDRSAKGYALFYNTPFVKNIFRIGSEVYLYGQISRAIDQIYINHPTYIFQKDIKESETPAKIMPVYQLADGISQKERARIQENALQQFEDCLQEFLPEDILERNRLCRLPYALSNIHFPKTLQALKEARYRLIFDELFLLQLGLLLIKNYYERKGKGIAFNVPASVSPLIESLPFQLTDAQKKVLQEIQNDMESNKVMNRLVQGDVGSGKTIIALIALYKAVLNGYQGALMAPTEILAQQHFHSARQWLAPLGVRIALLSGSLSKKEKEKVLHEIQNGEIDLAIGTHALIQDAVSFKKLGLVVTDEQHRFGVRQRNLLTEKGLRPDVLVMTATPIPRTLALILYGDLDISIIDTLPPGRKKIKTRCISEKQRQQAYQFVRQQIQKGRQAYVIAPLIENSEVINAHSAIELYHELKEKIFPDIRIALLHGKMKWDEKEFVMRQFQSGEVQLLVSTTVVEVGVHVPNATVMLIENSERFGLAQLHQLRGRVGRGSKQSYCILVNNSNDPLTIQRLKTLEQVHDGFAVAEKDLELRGPGEFFGLRQHGLPEFKIANLFKHVKILKQAQKEAFYLIQEDRNLSLDKNIPLKNKIMDQFGDLFDQIGL